LPVIASGVPLDGSVKIAQSSVKIAQGEEESWRLPSSAAT
jgi:hypothetical protein